jgi:hypothetical protein
MRLSGIRTPDREASSRRTRQRGSCPQAIEITREPKWHGLCFRLGDMQVGHSAHIAPTATPGYARRRPENTVLYSIVQGHLATLLDAARDRSDRDFGHPGQQGIRSIGPAVLRG